VRHAPRPHPGPRQAGGPAGAARAAAPARRPAPDRPRLGDGAAAGARRVGSARRRARPACRRGRRRTHRRGCPAGAAGARSAGRRGDARRARRGRRARRACRDRPDAPGGRLDCPARRGRRARHVRRRACGHLLRRGDPGRTRAGRVPGAVPRPLDSRQRLVGVVRPGGQPLLGRAGGAPVGRLHHAQRDGLPGGRRRLVARRRALRSCGVLRLRPPGARGLRRRDAGPGGGPTSASTSSTPSTSPTGFRSPAQPSSTRAWSAAGRRPSRRAPTARPRPSAESLLRLARRRERRRGPGCARARPRAPRPAARRRRRRRGRARRSG
jgi:hypothetical protein